MKGLVRSTAVLLVLAAAGFATSPCCRAQSLDTPAGRALLGGLDTPNATQRLYGTPLEVEPRNANILRTRTDTEALSVEALASRISYVGAFLLTADQIVRSMDSVLETVQIRCDDGTRVRFDMNPGSRGVGMGIRVSRPIEF